MKLTIGKKKKRFRTSITERPWGDFIWFSRNEPSTVKILRVKYGESLSLQYHFNRDQLYYILDEDFLIEYSRKKIPLTGISGQFIEKYVQTDMAQTGDAYGFMRGYLHRVSYFGKRKHGRILDVAFGKNDEKDIIRVEDNYGRK